MLDMGIDHEIRKLPALLPRHSPALPFSATRSDVFGKPRSQCNYGLRTAARDQAQEGK
jgi:hypothetical protein